MGGYHLFDDKLKMISKFITEFPKLGFPLVFETELEGLLGDRVVQSLYSGVRPEYLN